MKSMIFITICICIFSAFSVYELLREEDTQIVLSEWL